MILDGAVFDAAMDEIRQRSKKILYQRDFAAWQWDVLGERTYEKLAEIGHDVLLGPKPRTLVKSGNGTAKDLALDTPILTTAGWSTMGELCEGDYVYDEQGQPTRITVKSEVMHNKCYRITFDDGSSFIAGEGHLWNTLDTRARANAGRNGGVTDWREHWDLSETLMTREIAATVGGEAGPRNHLVPLARPLQYPKRRLPLAPYVLGAWLGDGTTIRAEITCDYAADGYVVDQIEAAGYPMRHDMRAAEGGRRYSFKAVCDGPDPRRGKRSSRLKIALRDAGVLGNKHIPEAYLRASVDQRIALVRGLMDTDGTADKRGSTAALSQSNETLVHQFEELLSGLGVRYSTTSTQPARGARAWRVAFRSWFDPFTPGERKSRIYQASSSKQASRTTGRTIVSVEPTLTVPTACISVEADSRLYLAGRTLVPTHNTFQMARWAMWWVTAFEPEESLAIITAPTLRQVEGGVMAYMKTSYGYVKQSALADGRPMPWPGWISEQNVWKYGTDGGNMNLVVGRVPSAQDAVSTLQGERKIGGRNFIGLDEAGGVSRHIFTAIEALMTGGDSRMGGIGNPDQRGTAFYEAFTDPRLAAEYSLHTISGYDLPTMTGEIVYRDDPDKQRLMLKGLTSAEWICHKERVWKTGGEIVYDEEIGLERNLTGRPDGRFKAKVLGQFPEEDDHTFFAEEPINAAREREIEAPEAPIVLGVDLATTGTDESVVMVNKGGRCRVFAGKVKYDDGGEMRETTGTWAREDELTGARRVHAIATYLGATEVRVDAAGIGAGIATNLERLDEFAGKQYVVIRVSGAVMSADKNRWSNTRSQIYDNLREMLTEGTIDIDYEDMVLKDQMLAVTYDTNNRGAIQITPKKLMRSEMHGSPDRLDALVYAAIDTTPLTGNPYAHLAPGEKIIVDPREITFERRNRAGYPV